MTSHTLYMTSHTWPHKSYICHFTLYIWHYIHGICVIKPRVSIAFYPLCVCHYTFYLWHHIPYTWHHMYTLWHHTRIGVTSHPVYLWYHIQYIWSHAYSFMKTNDYTWNLTHCIWRHSYCICVVTAALSKPLQQLWESSHLAHVWHHTNPTSQFQTLWHQFSVFRTLQKLHSWHQISYTWYHSHGLWHLIPYTCDITATIYVT